MPSYDVHQHLWPEELVRALRARREPPCLRDDVLELDEGSFRTDLGEHDLDRRLALLDRDEIDIAVVSLPPTIGWERYPELAQAFHEGIAEVAAASSGRLLPLACGECREGLAGACISAAAGVAGVGRLAEELERAGQVLFVHPGPPERVPEGMPPWWTALDSYTGQMQSAYLAWVAGGAERYPNLPVIFAILAGGAPIQLDRLRSRGVEVGSDRHPNLHFDTASYGRAALGLCVETYGVGRLLYGSDAPVIDTRPTRRALEELGEAVQSAVLRENPTRLFA